MNSEYRLSAETIRDAWWSAQAQLQNLQISTSAFKSLLLLLTFYPLATPSLISPPSSHRDTHQDTRKSVPRLVIVAPAPDSVHLNLRSLDPALLGLAGQSLRGALGRCLNPDPNKQLSLTYGYE